MSKAQNLQDAYLNEARRKAVPITVFLVNGFQMRGTVSGFDNFTLALESDGRQQLIYKHAISTIAPSRRLDLRGEQPQEERPQGEEN